MKQPENWAGLLNCSPVVKRSNEGLSEMHVQEFERKVERYQDTNDPAEVERLRQEISQELFGA